MAPRIFIVASNFAPELTGIGKYVGDMAQWLADQGCEVEVVAAPPYYPAWKVASGWSGARWRRERASGATVTRCPLYVPARPTAARRLLHLASFAATSTPVILARCILWRPHVVIVVEPPLACAPAALFGARLVGAHAWLHVQDFEVDAAFDLGVLRAPLLRRLMQACERVLMRSFDRVSTISDRMLERLADKGVPERRRTLFPNWVDMDQIRPGSRLAPLREELGASADDVVVLYSGNFGQKQGIELLQQAAEQLRDTPQLRLIFCGAGDAFERFARATSGLAHVRCAPLQPAERLGELMAIADIHVLPQREDAESLVMPSKLVTMLASGRPVVATARPGSDVAHAASHGGLVVPPGDVRGFCDAVLVLMRDAALRERLGTAGRQFAAEHWSRDDVLHRAFAAYLPPWSTAVGPARSPGLVRDESSAGARAAAG